MGRLCGTWVDAGRRGSGEVVDLRSLRLFVGDLRCDMGWRLVGPFLHFPTIPFLSLPNPSRTVFGARVAYSGTLTDTAARSAQSFILPTKQKATLQTMRHCKTTNCEDRRIFFHRTFQPMCDPRPPYVASVRAPRACKRLACDYIQCWQIVP